MPEQPEKPPAAPDAALRARQQAEAYQSVFAPTRLELDGGDTITIPPHPNLRMLDDDCMDAYDELLFEADTKYDREPDLQIPEQKLDNGVVLPAEVKRGALKVPYRISGQLVKPSYSVRVVQAALGEQLYKKLRDGGRNAADVWRIWNNQGLKVADRQDGDQFPDAGADAVAPVPG
jgi:hypothetical protein